MEDANIYQGNISLSCPFPSPLLKSCTCDSEPFFKDSTIWGLQLKQICADQVQSSKCVTLAMKPDSDLRQNEFKSRINYSPPWTNRAVSAISLIPATCSGQTNALAPPICFLPDSASFHQHPGTPVHRKLSFATTCLFPSKACTYQELLSTDYSDQTPKNKRIFLSRLL